MLRARRVTTVKPARTLGRKHLLAARNMTVATAVVKLRSCQSVCCLELHVALTSRMQTEHYPH
jgi:hypothetical protein